MEKLKEAFNKYKIDPNTTTLYRIIVKPLGIIIKLLISIFIFFIIHYLILFFQFKIPISYYLSNMFHYKLGNQLVNLQISKTEAIIKDSTILIGALTIWITLITFYIQKVFREQDMVKNFPDLSVQDCYFYFDNNIIFNNAEWLYQINSNIAVKIKFKSAFSGFFEPEIYRVWVVRSRRLQYGSAEKNKIKIVKSGSELDDDFLCIGFASDDTSKENLIYKICKETWIENKTVELIFDVKWKSYKREVLYLRTYALLDKPIISETNDQTNDQIYCCKIKNRKILGAPLLIWKW